MSMKLGVVLPQNETTGDPDALRAFTEAAEAAGYDHLVVYDHVLGANPDRPGGWVGPYTHVDPFHEPFVLFGFLAAWTERIELVTEVLILPQRQTALVAKQAAEVDLLSRGRLRLGVGLGWNEVEYEALGMSFHDRGRRVEEQIDLIRRLWRDPLVTFEGRDHRVTDAGILPLPGRRIPIWMGGSAEPALRRAARVADGWMMNHPLEKAPEALDRVRGYLAEAGREASEFGIEARVGFSTASTRRSSRPRGGRRWG